MNIKFSDVIYGSDSFWYVFNEKDQKYLHKDGTWRTGVRGSGENINYKSWGGMYNSKEEAEETYKRFTEPQEVLKNFVCSYVALFSKSQNGETQTWLTHTAGTVQASDQQDAIDFVTDEAIKNCPPEKGWYSHHIIVREMRDES
jgi:hypothetical protein